MKIKHILVDMDPTKDEQPALQKGIMLARQFGASIELFLADYHSGLVTNWLWNEAQTEKAKKAYIASKQRWLDSYLAMVTDEKLSVSTDVRWHKPVYEGVIEKAIDCNADLVIKSTHFHPKLNKLFFTPNDWQLLKRCPVPLLLAKDSTANEYGQIMAAVDPARSHDKPECLDKMILSTVNELSTKLSANAQVAHCYESVGVELWHDLGVGAHGLDMQSFDHVEYLKQLEKHHREEFEKLIEGYEFNESNRHLENGVAHKLLPDIVKDCDIDLLVMGATYRTGLIGGMAEKILDEINCDVLALKPE